MSPPPDAAADPAALALEQERWQEARALLEPRCAGRAGGDDLLGLGEALYWCGETARALATLRRAHAAGRRDGDAAVAATACVWLYFLYRASVGNAVAARGWLGRLTRLVAAADLGPIAGWEALLRGDDRMLAGDLEGAVALTEEALAAAEEAGDLDLELCAVAQLGEAHVAAGRLQQGLPLLDEAMAGALAGDGVRPDTVVFALCTMVTACTRSAQFGRAARWVRVGDELAGRIDLPYMHTTCRIGHGQVLFAMGRLDEAAAVLDEAARMARGGEPALAARALAGLARVRLAQGRVDEGAALAEGLQDHGPATSALAEAALALGRPGDALRPLRRRLRAVGDDDLEASELVDLLAEAEAARGGATTSAAVADDLARRAADAGCPLAVARARRAMGRIAAARGEPDAGAHIDAALDAFCALEMPYEAARTRLLAAEVLAGGDPEAAAAEARAAHRALAEMGAARAADRARALLRRLGVRAGSGAGPRGTDALTRREAEVLELLARGLSNPAIAERLVVSRKTVERHVQHVLQKLGLRNRAEAAAHAVRHGGRGPGPDAPADG